MVVVTAPAFENYEVQVIVAGDVVGVCLVSELPEFFASYRCETACPGWFPGLLKSAQCHSFATRRMPAEPDLLDLIGWRA